MASEHSWARNLSNLLFLKAVREQKKTCGRLIQRQFILTIPERKEKKMVQRSHSKTHSFVFFFSFFFSACRSAGRPCYRSPTCLLETQRPNIELFSLNSHFIHYRSWNYRGCWHQACPPIALRAFAWAASFLKLYSSREYGVGTMCNYLRLEKKSCFTTFFCVAIRVIFVPAAFHRSGSRVSGYLSGIEL
jgi:hypothetical protein